LENESNIGKHSPTIERLRSQNTTPVPATFFLTMQQIEKRALYSRNTTPVRDFSDSATNNSYGFQPIHP